MIPDDDEDLSINYSDNSQDDNMEEGEDDSDEEGDFFDGEGLSDVDLGDKQGSDDEEGLDSDEDMLAPDYGSEDESEGEALPEFEGQKKPLSAKEQRKQLKKQTKAANTFADYEEFAHLLDGDSDEENDKHMKAKISGHKRTYQDKNTNFQKGGRQTYKSKRPRK